MSMEMVYSCNGFWWHKLCTVRPNNNKQGSNIAFVQEMWKVETGTDYSNITKIVARFGMDSLNALDDAQTSNWNCIITILFQCNFHTKNPMCLI